MFTRTFWLHIRNAADIGNYVRLYTCRACDHGLASVDMLSAGKHVIRVLASGRSKYPTMKYIYPAIITVPSTEAMPKPSN